MQDSRFAVFDLRFDCRYSVHLQPISRDGVTGHVTRLSLTLPPCQQVTVVGLIRPDCADTGELSRTCDATDGDSAHLVSELFILLN